MMKRTVGLMLLLMLTLPLWTGSACASRAPEQQPMTRIYEKMLATISFRFWAESPPVCKDGAFTQNYLSARYPGKAVMVTWSAPDKEGKQRMLSWGLRVQHGADAFRPIIRGGGAILSKLRRGMRRREAFDTLDVAWYFPDFGSDDPIFGIDPWICRSIRLPNYYILLGFNDDDRLVKWTLTRFGDPVPAPKTGQPHPIVIRSAPSGEPIFRGDDIGCWEPPPYRVDPKTGLVVLE